MASKQMSGRSLSGVRIFPEEMDILPSSSASRGTVTTVPTDEINPYGSPTEYRNAGTREYVTPVSSQSKVHMCICAIT